jgi:hypothetical protein
MTVVPLINQFQQESQGPRGIVTNTLQEVIDKTPPQLILNIKHALRQKAGAVRVWAGLKKRLAKLKFKP